MAIGVRLKCSDCGLTRQVKIKAEEQELECPSCGRRGENLSSADHQVIAATLSKQQILGIVSLVLFLAAAFCLLSVFSDHSKWLYVKSGKGFNPPAVADNTFFFITIVLGLASMITGMMSSVKRYVVEF